MLIRTCSVRALINEASDHLHSVYLLHFGFPFIYQPINKTPSRTLKRIYLNRKLLYPWCCWSLQSLPGWDPKRDCSGPAGGPLEAEGTCRESCLDGEKTSESPTHHTATGLLICNYNSSCNQNNCICVSGAFCFSLCYNIRRLHRRYKTLSAFEHKLSMFLYWPPTTVDHESSSYQQGCCLGHSPTLGRCWCPTARKTEDPERSATTDSELKCFFQLHYGKCRRQCFRSLTHTRD